MKPSRSNGRQLAALTMSLAASVFRSTTQYGRSIMRTRVYDTLLQLPLPLPLVLLCVAARFAVGGGLQVPSQVPPQRFCTYERTSFLFLFSHFYSPTQPTKYNRLLLSDLLNKPSSQMSSPSSKAFAAPVLAFIFIAHNRVGVPTFQLCMLVDFHRILILPTHTLALLTFRYAQR